jgi:hypothetical protein
LSLDSDEKFLLGQIDGRTTQILAELCEVKATVQEHSAWIAERAGADRVRGNVVGKAWQVAIMILGPVIGGAVGAWFARKGVVKP